jgi:hypothetical protein
MKTRSNYTSYSLNSSMKPRGPGQKHWLTILLLFAGAGGIIMGMVLLYFMASEPRQGEDLCWLDTPIPASADVVVDPTDAFPPVEMQALRLAVQRRVATLEAGSRLTLSVIRPEGQGPLVVQLFSCCKPRDGSKVNILFETEGVLKRRYQTEFVQPLEAALRTIEAYKDEKTSPILAALYQVAGSIHAGDAAAPAPRHLLIVSDLLEFSSTLSMYEPAYSWANVLKDPRVRAMQGLLAGVDITVLLRSTPRTKQHQHAQHRAFWEKYLDHAGVPRFHWQPL